MEQQEQRELTALREARQPPGSRTRARHRPSCTTRRSLAPAPRAPRRAPACRCSVSGQAHFARTPRTLGQAALKERREETRKQKQKQAERSREAHRLALQAHHLDPPPSSPPPSSPTPPPHPRHRRPLANAADAATALSTSALASSGLALQANLENAEKKKEEGERMRQENSRLKSLPSG